MCEGAAAEHKMCSLAVSNGVVSSYFNNIIFRVLSHMCNLYIGTSTQQTIITPV